MKWIAACVVGIALLCACGHRTARADMIPGPPTVDPKLAEQHRDKEPEPDNTLYMVTWSIVAATTGGSLVALRRIRNHNAKCS